MTAEPMLSLPAIAVLFKALADDTRLSIIRMLALTDLKAGEISDRLGAPQNAVSYHLRYLRAAGLLRDRHSSQDARDVYYSIDLDHLQQSYLAAGAAVHPGLMTPQPPPALRTDGPSPLRLLFLCTHNSARSQLAEGLARKLGDGQVEAYSAGTAPVGVHPLTVRLLGEWDIDAGPHFSKTLDRFAGQAFDCIVTVCDRAREVCPVFPNGPVQLHWSLPDPLSAADPEAQWQIFRNVGVELATRIRCLLQLLAPAVGAHRA